MNPKDEIGVKKVSLDLVPDSGVIHAAMAFKEGARKYGAFNWRSNPVQNDIYVAAARRHIAQYFNGENIDVASGVHNLGCAIACLMIILDSEEKGNIIDNRPAGIDVTSIMSKVLKTYEDAHGS